MEKNTVHRSGALLINKPAGATSHDIVRDIRRIVGGKVGHSGTLDPFATGLLIILLGHATRLQDELHMLAKTYESEITLGATSDTDDITGTITKTSTVQPSQEQVQKALDRIKQQTSQIPPQYAAIKVNGKKLYEYARKGEMVERNPRAVTIHGITLQEYTYPIIKISVTCSTGTYIRSLARDIGEVLGTGAHCSALARTAIGQFELKEAFSPEELPEDIRSAVVLMEDLVSHIPSLICPDESVAKYKQGKVGECDTNIPLHTPIALLDKNKKMFGIGIRETEEWILKPKKIFLHPPS